MIWTAEDWPEAAGDGPGASGFSKNPKKEIIGRNMSFDAHI
jgi:hypothetical protein